jgi:hypothetical protein
LSVSIKSLCSEWPNFVLTKLRVFFENLTIQICRNATN